MASAIRYTASLASYDISTDGHVGELIDVKKVIDNPNYHHAQCSSFPNFRGVAGPTKQTKVAVAAEIGLSTILGTSALRLRSNLFSE